MEWCVVVLKLCWVTHANPAPLGSVAHLVKGWGVGFFLVYSSNRQHATLLKLALEKRMSSRVLGQSCSISRPQPLSSLVGCGHHSSGNKCRYPPFFWGVHCFAWVWAFLALCSPITTNFCSIKPMLKSSDILAQSQLHVFLLAGSQNCSIIFVGFSIGFMLEKRYLLMPKIPIPR